MKRAVQSVDKEQNSNTPSATNCNLEAKDSEKDGTEATPNYSEKSSSSSETAKECSAKFSKGAESVKESSERISPDTETAKLSSDSSRSEGVYELQKQSANSDEPSEKIEEESETEITQTFGREAEQNEHFDKHFYKNLIPTRQHDSTKRLCDTASTRHLRNTEVSEMCVLARVVDENEDHIERITVKQTSYIASGYFSDVYKGTVIRTGEDEANCEPLAIKRIWPDPSKEDRQIDVHRLLHHPNITRLLYYFVCVHPTTRRAVWTLIMELMPSTVGIEHSKYIDRGRIMPQIYAKLWIYQTLTALAYMEKKKIMHRDIKPDNLLVDFKTAFLKLGDFGSAKRFINGDTNNPYQVTRYYRAPELCLGYPKYDCTVDIWSTGCVLVELLTNRIVFYGRNNADQLRKIIRICGTPSMKQLSCCIPGHYVNQKLIAKQYPPVDWYNLLRRYNKTITRECVSFLTGMLRYECQERLRGKRALEHPYFDTLRTPGARLPNGNPFPEFYSF